MDETLTGTVHGNTIVLDSPLSLRDGQSVEVVVRTPRTLPPSMAVDPAEMGPPAWWSDEDDRILAEIYRARKCSTRSTITERVSFSTQILVQLF